MWQNLKFTKFWIREILKFVSKFFHVISNYTFPQVGYRNKRLTLPPLMTSCCSLHLLFSIATVTSIVKQKKEIGPTAAESSPFVLCCVRKQLEKFCVCFLTNFEALRFMGGGLKINEINLVFFFFYHWDRKLWTLHVPKMNILLLCLIFHVKDQILLCLGVND